MSTGRVFCSGVSVLLQTGSYVGYSGLITIVSGDFYPYKTSPTEHCDACNRFKDGKICSFFYGVEDENFWAGEAARSQCALVKTKNVITNILGVIDLAR